MYKKISGLMNRFILQGHERSIKAKKNILASFGIKGFSILISFVKVPIILSYLDVGKYGVWLTIASIIEWVHFLDLGIGQGLRNKFAQALALNDEDRAKRLVSTAYYYMSLIFLGTIAIIIPLIYFLNWQKILNVKTISKRELVYSVTIVLFMFIFRFVLNLISLILKADQKSALSDIFLPISNIIVLILVLLINSFSKNSLFLACVVISVPPALVLLISNFYYFNRQYSKYKPAMNHVDKKLFRDIFSLGFKFFFIQMASLVMFSSSNIILAQVVNPAEVSVFNIARQYFGIPLMAFSIILTPIWSAITDAYTRGDTKWIKNVMNKLLFISILFSVGMIVMLAFSGIAFKIWLNGKVNIPFKLSLIMAFYNVCILFLSPFSHFLNGTGKLKLSLWIAPFDIILFIPVAIFLTHKFGAFGLVLALILINSVPGAIQETTQYWKIINNRARGIWNA